MRLDAEKAPLTVDNFSNYASHETLRSDHLPSIVKQPVQVVLGGVYTADLKEGGLTPIRNEADNGLKNRRGTIAMLHRTDDEDRRYLPVFFNLSDNDSLNFKSRTAEGYGFCVFGEVTDGLEVLDRIAKRRCMNSGKFVGPPVETVAIRSVHQIR